MLFGSVASNWSWLLGTVPPLRKHRTFPACDLGVRFGKAEYIRQRLQAVPIGYRAKLFRHICQVAGSGSLAAVGDIIVTPPNVNLIIWMAELRVKRVSVGK
jgi:hypothetical protein